MVDGKREARGFFSDYSPVLLGLFLVADNAIGQIFRGGRDDRERGFQFMGDGSDELLLPERERFRFATCSRERDEKRDEEGECSAAYQGIKERGLP